MRRIFEGAMIMAFFFGVMLAASDSNIVWPYNVIAGCVVIVASGLGLIVCQKN